MLILIKAYRILRSYLVSHHISVEYIVEISIIASAIEFVFAFDAHSSVNNIALAVFGIANLFIYLHYFGVDESKSPKPPRKRKRS